MRVKFVLFLFLAFLSYLNFISVAQADQEWLVFGDLNLSNLRSSNLPGYGFKYGDSVLGGGLGTFVPLSDFFGIEADLVYFSRDVFVRGAGDDINRLRSKYLELPIQLKLMISQFIRVGGGIYFAKGFGPVTLTHADGSKRTTSFTDADISSNDFGVIGSGVARFPVSDSIQVFAEVRYQRGLKNVGLAIPFGTEVHYTDVKILFGVSFAFEEIQNRIKPNQFYFRPE